MIIKTVKVGNNVFMAEGFWKIVIQHVFDRLKEVEFPNVAKRVYEKDEENEKEWH